MDEPIIEEIARLERALANHPGSEELRERLLEALSADPESYSDPRRLQLIAWFLENNPRHRVCSTPFAHMDPKAAPTAYRDLKTRWLALVRDSPDDSELARGAALFIASEDAHEATALLRAAIDRAPDDPQLWLALGRISVDPCEQLSAFEHARQAGETLPNLLVWIAMAAFRGGEFVKAENGARELMLLVDEARQRFGDKLDWADSGSALWRRARETTGNDETAAELTDAISQHAYRKHWAHTVLGLLACREGDLDRAVVHLLASADIRPDYRLSSYGPSLELLREICIRGRWDDGLEYLHRWERIWNDPRVRGWIEALERQRLPPTNDRE
jgi:tetratricopeptide (TPR) repeat protein